MTPISSAPLTPSATLLRFINELTSSYGPPILDAPSGAGRNALALAALGYDVVAVDKDVSRLTSMEKFAQEGICSSGRSKACGRIISVCADLTTNLLPFAKGAFSAAICIHYPVQRIISDLDAAIRNGGHIYIETFGGQGQNYLDLPKAGEIRTALKEYHFDFYKERPVGPPSQNSVVVKALGRKSP